MLLVFIITCKAIFYFVCTIFFKQQTANKCEILVLTLITIYFKNNFKDSVAASNW